MLTATIRFFDSHGPHSANLDGNDISIGRSPDQNIVLRDALVSRHHAVISREGDQWSIADQNSTHGTYLNAVRVEQAVLKSGDVLQMGSLEGRKLRFLIHTPDPVTGTLDQRQLEGLLSSMDEIHGQSTGVRPAREMAQLNWLIHAARQLNDGVGIDDILGALLQSTLQLTGVERGFVFLWTEGEARFAQGLGPTGRIFQEDQTISRKAILKAIKSNSKFSVSDTSQDQMTSGWESVIINEIRSIHCIPLRLRVSPNEPMKLLGLLYLDSRISPGSLTEIDHQILDTLSTEAATLLQNALLAESEQRARQAREELAIAARIHSGLMSIALPSLPYAEIHARSVPCLAIGGDFYDVVALQDCVCAVIVDVSGKGVAAAIVAATLQGIIHAQLLGRQGLPEIAAVVNRFLNTRNVGKYATMVIVKLFPDGRLEYVNCGHLAPIAINGKEIRRLEASNMVVGLIPDAAYTSAEDALQNGERLILTTDGVTEAEDADGRQFEEVWLHAVTECRDMDEMLEQVARFHAPAPAQDDCTLVEVHFRGQA